MFQFRRFPSYHYGFMIRSLPLPVTWFPNSEICGLTLICSYPQLIAACHVLLRLLVARHSPCALFSLIGLVLFSEFSLEFMIFWNCRTISIDIATRFNFVFITFSCYSIFKVRIWVTQGNLVEMRRIELLTPCLQGRCSPSWATPPCSHLCLIIFSSYTSVYLKN